MGKPAPNTLQRNLPPRAPQARNAEILAWKGGHAPTRHRGRAFGYLIELRGTTEHECGHTRRFRRELKALRGGCRISRDLTYHTGQPGMAEAFFHRQQDVGVCSRLDIDHPVWMQPSEMESRSEQVAPPEAPENGTFDPGEDSREKRGGARIVREFGTACDLMESACCDATSWQPAVEFA